MDADDAPVATSVQEAWDRHIERTLSTPEGPSVQTLLALAEDHGEEPPGRVLPHVAVLCTADEVQRAWAQWTAVTDREELRLRLEVLRQVDILDPSLNPFVLFFFRASDPVLYQAAARVLGTHLESNPELEDFLRAFAEEHSVQLDRPIPLIGERSHRRLLITQAARRAGGATETSVLATDDPDTYLAASILDLNAVLVATHVLVESGRTASEEQVFAVRMLEGLAEHSAVTTADPSLIRSWGRLLAALDECSPPRVAELWSALLRRVSERPKDTFSAHLQRLTRIDEVVHSAVCLAGERQEAVRQSLRSCSDTRLRRFLQYRWRLWAERDGGHPPDELSKVGSFQEVEESSVLHDLIQAEVGTDEETSLLGERSAKTRRLSVFVELLDAMGQKTGWLRRPVEQRALIAFSALDLSRYLPLPAPAVDATFADFDYPTLREEPEPHQDDGQQWGRAGPATFRILLRLAEWEEAGTERLVATHLLHQIADSYVLMMLLPSRRATELTAPLADAIEHQLRLHLQTKPDFRPAQFLYETSVRAPHPQFYEHLQHICETRTYTDTRGGEVPIAAFVARLLEEARSVRDSSVSPAEAADASSWPGDPSFAEGLRYVRSTLTAVRNEADLIDGLERLLDALDPKSKDPATGPRKVFGVLGRGGAPAIPLVHRRRSGAGPRTYQAVREKVQEDVLALREVLPHLQPATLDGVHDIRDEALHAEDTLDAIEAQVVPVLGVVEGRLLRETLRHLKSQLQSWTDALTTLHAQWQEVRERAADPSEGASQLFGEILARGEDPIRGRLLTVLARTLIAASDPETGALDAADAWARGQRILEWALDPTQLERLSRGEAQAWTDVFAARWSDMLTRAMEEGYESRVLRLTTEKRFAPLRKMPGAADLLAEVRTWFFDRYHLPAARQVTSALRSHSSIRSVAGATTAFFVHFSRVWLALLLGAVLMLDFGDAWTAMAAEGDVVSVLVTFVVGVMGTFGYLFVDLRSKVQRAPEENVWRVRRSRWGRLMGFLGLCLAVTGGLTTTLWLLLSGTGAVVEGTGAALHVVVWTGFALFVGVFFGLIAETA